MPRLETQLLAHAGRLLLEYNESSREIDRILRTTAQAITAETCEVVVSYGGVSITLGDGAPLRIPVRELHSNAELQTRVQTILR